MATDFGARLTRLAHLSGEQRNAMASELFADPQRLQDKGMWDAFDAAIDDLAMYSLKKAVTLRKDEGKPLSRQNVYRDHFTAEDDEQSVILGRFRRPGRDNPFLFELKKYVDLIYNSNLPDHLKRYTFTPANLPTRMAMQDAPGAGYDHEQVSALVSDRDMLDAVRRSFMAHSQKAMSLPVLRDLTVADVVEIRQLPAWEPFKEAQAQILKHPLQCLVLLDAFQQRFDDFQQALSLWYGRKYQRRHTEERYCSHISLALSLAGKLIVAGSHLNGVEKALVSFAGDQVVAHIPKKVKGYAAKLMVGVYDLGQRRLDADRTYTIELMQTNTELLREDVVELLRSISRHDGADIPAAANYVADQGIL